MTAGQLRNALAVFYFRGDDVFKDLSSLSGGEKARLALLKLMLHHDNTLLLDEPTNHLDSDVREALESAMEGFEGTVVAVSHDRYFINRVANRIVSFQSDGGVIDVPGNYDDYLAYLERLKNPNAARNDEGPTRTAVKKQQKQSRETTKQRRGRPSGGRGRSLRRKAVRHVAVARRADRRILPLCRAGRAARPRHGGMGSRRRGI